MLRIHAGSRAEGAKSYFDQGLSREDYYAEGSEVTGCWHGLAAERLGLVGDVDRDDFHALCDNQIPGTQDHLTPRQRSDRRVGFDISFSVPKSVSIHHALTGNDDIERAFRAAVNETMVEIERDPATRVRRDGANGSRITGNLAWAEFLHFTSRPVDGRSDPHLHAHCFTFNATFDSHESRWKALELSEVWKNAPYYQAAFDARIARIARMLSDLGYGIERAASGWELAGYSRDTIERFSRRTSLIEKFAKANGVSDAKDRGDLGARTREAKGEGQDKNEQRAEWASRLSAPERQALAAIEARRNTSRIGDLSEQVTPADCLDHATLQAFERQSVVREANFLAEALAYGVGKVSVDAVRHEYDRRVRAGTLLAASLNGRMQVSTHHVLAEERAMVDYARAGRGSSFALGSAQLDSGQVRTLFADGPEPDEKQLGAVAHVLTSTHQVIVVRGKAGTGKTTMMQAAAKGIRRGGRRVFAFAPSSEASRGVLREEGFLDATTVQRLLVDEKLQAEIRGQVIWIDEAGLLGARTMRQVFDLAEKLGARIVLSGDSSQHAAVERGDALRILESEAGLEPAELTSIYRQRDRRYMEAVRAISSGDADGVAAGFDILQEMGSIAEIDDELRYEALAKDYVSAVLDQRKSALVVSPTHREGAAVTAAIRAQLKERQALEGQERRIDRLRDLSWTEARKRDSAQYREGLVLQFHQGGNGYRRGDRAEVVGIRGTRVMVSVRGQVRELNMSLAERFAVFERQDLDIAVGDQIRITRNGMALSTSASGRVQELRNGASYEVAEFTPNGDIRAVRRSAKGKVTSEVVIGRDYGHVAHGYCVTSHASQGRTVDRVFIAQGSDSLAASSREQFYVSVSRGRESVKIYTDDAAVLRDQVIESGARISAIELAREATRLRVHHAVKLAHSASLKAGRRRSTQPATRDHNGQIGRAYDAGRAL